MDSIHDRMIRRARDVVSGLESCCASIDAVGSPSREVSDDGTIMLSEDESSILCKDGGELLASYMTYVCRGCDAQGARRLSDEMSESLQAQFLVERDCMVLYSSVFFRYLMQHLEGSVASEPPIYDGTPCLSIAVEPLLRYRPARLVLSILSDFSIADGTVRLNSKDHGTMFLRRIGHVACESSPLQREVHVKYIAKHLTLCGPARTVPLEHLNCSEPWIVYWSLHSLRILGVDISPYRERALKTLFGCWDKKGGGFGGGRGQIGHLATTYAAICCLKMLNALPLLDTGKLRSFLFAMKKPDGSFSVHLGGECDVRGLYCAIASASMAGILDDELSEGVAARVAACQGYDGGISGEPFLESHAGYVYCGTSALKLLNRLDCIDVARLRRWCHLRQTPQLGFQGRPHKLVDVCYAFWIGGTLALLDDSADKPFNLSYLMLQAYILCISQFPSGGFRDKPGKAVDLYHTCYALSALEIISQPSGKCRLDVSLNIIV
ncbi:farnesyltransferase beta [Babesia ovata]|uniref:Farnesyltransferase beta n=1 Tax=Babesia ovata TaxID=189622 RepID=A0A2H6K8B1_9APIC|nr:farnesyltransferase beta [Babesia ovata]GBE59189.1 farnesyltransferase beta [Babesia ovata]